MIDYNELSKRIEKNDGYLSSLDLSRDCYHYGNLLQIFKALINNTNVHTVWIRSRRINVEEATALEKVLFHNKSIRKLIFCDVYFNCINDVIFVRSFDASSKLTELSFDCFKFNKGVLGSLAKALSENKQLEKLCISDSNIGALGAKQISESLYAHRNLKYLDFFGNNIGPKGAEAVSLLLSKNKILRDLRLSCNQLGDTGAKHIAQALLKNSTLTDIQLMTNKINSKGINYFKEVLIQNTTLRKIDFSLNKIKLPAFQSLIKTLELNRSLLELEFMFNDFSRHEDKVKIEVNRILDKNFEREFKLSFLMGFHSRLGKDSALYKISTNAIFEPKLIGLLFQFVDNSRREVLNKKSSFLFL